MKNDTSAMKVFISYAREDIEIAKKLRNDLEKAGINTWLDKEDLLPGQPWKTVILKEIRESSHFIALLSSKALSKEGFVQKELKTALDYLDYLPSGRAFVIPARIDECEPTDEKLQDIHWADLFPSYEDGLNKILKALELNTRVEPKKEESVPQLKTSKPKYQLRKEPITVSDEEFKEVFGLNESWRPLEYIQNDFRDNGDGTITDYATGLIWQKSGSLGKIYLRDVLDYIGMLNREKLAGYSDWRLPTVDELKSLLTQEKQSDDLYISPIFDKTQWWCWTSDKRGIFEAWNINFYGSNMHWDYGNRYYVRAVRSRQ